MISIRDYGDRWAIVIYTNERAVATQLGNLKDCFKIVPYEQEQYSKKKVALIGVDYYFPKKSLKGLLKKLGATATRKLPRFGNIQL